MNHEPESDGDGGVWMLGTGWVSFSFLRCLGPPSRFWHHFKTLHVCFVQEDSGGRHTLAELSVFSIEMLA